MIRVCPLAELPPGEALRLDGNPAIAVFHTEDGEVFAVDDSCTHQSTSLAGGWLDGCEIECPLHHVRFDLQTGEPDGPPASRPIRTHQVSIVDGDIYVAVSSEPPASQPGTVSPTGP